MSERVRVGRVGRPHGLEGAFVVENASEEAERFAVGATVLVGGTAVRILESKRAGGRPVIRVDATVERGAAIEVDRADLAELEDGSYYAFQLVGLEVEEEGGGALGRVVEISSAPANDVIELDSGLALPLVDACVREVDLESGRIVVKPGFTGRP
ncbi:MAG TPA: ribosome maturation factor RimM [Gaiellaceae bacterium]|nr:ribosome maturation factor RimM [Gaiellaceae bacterium]